MFQTREADQEAYRAQARALLLAQRAEEAEAAARAALALDPNDNAARYTLGRALLMLGRWSEGWPLYDYRPFRFRVGIRAAPFPEWRGEPIVGKRILVWGEQGLGDEIMLARFVPRLRDLGASEVVLACHELNIRAFQQLGADQVLPHGPGKVQVPVADYWVLLGSLPGLLGVTPDNLSGAPYLKAESIRRGGIALVEQGNPQNPVDADRSLPAGLLRVAVPDGQILQPLGDTFDSLRALVGLDLLITVDTSWAHMAGALGVPCWVLLPHRNLDWRWMRERRDTPWYRSLRLFRQPAPSEWSSLLAEVSAELEAQ